MPTACTMVWRVVRVQRKKKTTMKPSHRIVKDDCHGGSSLAGSLPRCEQLAVFLLASPEKAGSLRRTGSLYGLLAKLFLNILIKDKDGHAEISINIDIDE